MIFSYNFRINVTEVPVTVYECTLASLCRYAPVKPNQSTEAILQPEKSYSVNKKISLVESIVLVTLARASKISCDNFSLLLYFELRNAIHH